MRQFLVLLVLLSGCGSETVHSYHIDRAVVLCSKNKGLHLLDAGGGCIDGICNDGTKLKCDALKMPVHGEMLNQ